MALPPQIAECDHLSSVEASSSRHELIYKDIHHQMSLDDLPIHSEEEQRKLALILSRPSFGTQGGAHYDTSLFSSPIDTMPSMDNDGWDNFPADFLSLPVYEPSSLQILDGLFTDPNYSDASSSLSTPSHFPTSLSTSSSPNGGSPDELPLNDCRAVISSLPTDSRKQPPRRSAKKAPKKQVKPQGPTHLSSMLALTPEYVEQSLSFNVIIKPFLALPALRFDPMPVAVKCVGPETFLPLHMLPIKFLLRFLHMTKSG
jgi:myb proto-oncogene protein/Myb-like DNA-binding protein BAS1